MSSGKRTTTAPGSANKKTKPTIMSEERLRALHARSNDLALLTRSCTAIAEQAPSSTSDAPAPAKLPVDLDEQIRTLQAERDRLQDQHDADFKRRHARLVESALADAVRGWLAEQVFLVPHEADVAVRSCTAKAVGRTPFNFAPDYHGGFWSREALLCTLAISITSKFALPMATPVMARFMLNAAPPSSAKLDDGSWLTAVFWTGELTSTNKVSLKIRGTYPFDASTPVLGADTSDGAKHLANTLAHAPLARYDLLERVWAAASLMPADATNEDNLAAASLRAMFYKRVEKAITHDRRNGGRFFRGEEDVVQARMGAIGGTLCFWTEFF